MQMGTLPGMLCLVSSRNYPGQFTDKKEAEARTNKRIYVYDKRLWEIRPERFNGEKFRVFIGDETRKPRILEDDELVARGRRAAGDGRFRPSTARPSRTICCRRCATSPVSPRRRCIRSC